MCLKLYVIEKETVISNLVRAVNFTNEKRKESNSFNIEKPSKMQLSKNAYLAKASKRYLKSIYSRFSLMQIFCHKLFVH